MALDIDSSDSPVHGAQEQSAYNGHFESVCYHPLFVFNQAGDCLTATLRPGNVHTDDRGLAHPAPGPTQPRPAGAVSSLLGVAYNLGNLLRRLVLPLAIQSWSLLFKTGGRLIRHARYFILQFAESDLTRYLFGQILGRIERLAWHPT